MSVRVARIIVLLLMAGLVFWVAATAGWEPFIALGIMIAGLAGFFAIVVALTYLVVRAFGDEW